VAFRSAWRAFACPWGLLVQLMVSTSCLLMPPLSSLNPTTQPTADPPINHRPALSPSPPVPSSPPPPSRPPPPPPPLLPLPSPHATQQQQRQLVKDVPLKQLQQQQRQGRVDLPPVPIRSGEQREGQQRAGLLNRSRAGRRHVQLPQRPLEWVGVAG